MDDKKPFKLWKHSRMVVSVYNLLVVQTKIGNDLVHFPVFINHFDENVGSCCWSIGKITRSLCKYLTFVSLFSVDEPVVDKVPFFDSWHMLILTKIVSRFSILRDILCCGNCNLFLFIFLIDLDVPHTFCAVTKLRILSGLSLISNSACIACF